MNDSEFARTLSQSCQWWRNPDWAVDDPDLRKVKESTLTYEPNIFDTLSSNGLYTLRGPRRAGKSVEIKKTIVQLIAKGIEPRRIIRASCDGMQSKELRQVMRVGRDQLTAGIVQPRYWLLDEVTSVPEWATEIKWLRDNTLFGEDCVILTGSSAVDIDEACKQLAGRRGEALVSDRILLPMSFRQFCQQFHKHLPDVPTIRAADFLLEDSNDIIEEMKPWLDDLASSWEVYCSCGGFPVAVAQQKRYGEVNSSFVNTLFDIVHGEAMKGSRFTQNQTGVLLGEITKNMASFLNVEGVSRTIDVDRKTVKHRIQNTQEHYITWPCYQAGERNLPRLASAKKTYFVDPLFSMITHLRDPRYPAPDMSKRSEQQLGMHLLRQHAQGDATKFSDFSHVMCKRNSNGKEIDFVGPVMGTLGFEGKYSDVNVQRESATLKSITGKGVMATRALLGEHPKESKIKFIPTAFVAYLLND